LKEETVNRDEAMALVKEKVGNKNLVKHMIAVEACMRAMARHFDEDEELWGLAGLLHDVDYETTKDDPDKHGRIGAALLKEKGVDERIVHAVEAHPGHVECESNLDRGLYACDPITGLVVAAALMHPTKKIRNIDTEFVLRRFKEKRFAAGANREQIMTCEGLGLGLEEFTQLCLEAMQEVDTELGL
jgi:putative nucleotidyltransferase with HDIG domain